MISVDIFQIIPNSIYCCVASQHGPYQVLSEQQKKKLTFFSSGVMAFITISYIFFCFFCEYGDWLLAAAWSDLSLDIFLSHIAAHNRQQHRQTSWRVRAWKINISCRISRRRTMIFILWHAVTTESGPGWKAPNKTAISHRFNALLTKRSVSGLIHFSDSYKSDLSFNVALRALSLSVMDGERCERPREISTLWHYRLTLEAINQRIFRNDFARAIFGPLKIFKTS